MKTEQIVKDYEKELESIEKAIVRENDSIAATEFEIEKLQVRKKLIEGFINKLIDKPKKPKQKPKTETSNKTQAVTVKGSN